MKVSHRFLKYVQELILYFVLDLVIQNVQGNASCDSTQEALNKAKEMIQLTDSITLSVRGKDGQTIVPQQEPKLPPNPVADILATRGITVTPAAKSNGSIQSKPSNDNNAVAINLNNAVTLIPATKSKQRSYVLRTSKNFHPLIPKRLRHIRNHLCVPRNDLKLSSNTDFLFHCRCT